MNLSNEPFKSSAPLAPRADYRHSRRNGNARACDSASAACSRWSGGRCAMREHGPCSSIDAGCSSACSASSESRKDAARLESVRADAGAHENARRGISGGPIRLAACFCRGEPFCAVCHVVFRVVAVQFRIRAICFRFFSKLTTEKQM